MKFYQIGFAGAAVFWEETRNTNRATARQQGHCCSRFACAVTTRL